MCNYEADNHGWELKAIKNIQGYLTTGLQDLVKNGHVTIIA